MDLHYYQTRSGRRPFTEWLEALSDVRGRAKILARLVRLQAGSLGDARSVGGGVAELRIDWGPGYRVYFARIGQRIVLLLCAGDKGSQEKDIDRAKAYFEDYEKRAAPPG